MLLHRVDITDMVVALASQWPAVKDERGLEPDQLFNRLIIASAHELMLPNEVGGEVKNVFVVDEDAHSVLGAIGERVDVLGLNNVWVSFMGAVELGTFIAQLAKAVEAPGEPELYHNGMAKASRR